MSTDTVQHCPADSDDQWSMTEIVRVTGTTSRLLRHYGRIGLLPPSHTGPGGLGYYDQRGLLRLQRILVLRELGRLRGDEPVVRGNRGPGGRV